MKQVSDVGQSTTLLQIPNTHLATAIARRTALKLGCHHEIFMVDEGIIAQYFQDAVRHLGHDNPNFDFVARFALAKRVSEQGFKVILGGEF